MALKTGDTLFNGHYRILRLLGRGGFGFVYLAEDTLLAEEVAIKELIPALVGDVTMLKRFLAEAKATMRLTHERIVRTHNVFREGDNYYIVMEYMPGGSLEERLRAMGTLPMQDAVRIAAQICEGLDYAHRRQVVHCDLKPANILFAADGSAKVSDFGIAHVSGDMLSRSWHTPVGFVAGTLPYMSPEQTEGVRDDPRLDIYALGAVLYRMLLGRTYLDFDQQETPRAQADNVGRIYNQEPVPPSTYDPRIPIWLDAAVLKALSKRPEDRYASGEELRQALLMPASLQQAAHVPKAPAAKPAVPPTARPGVERATAIPTRTRRRPTWVWLAAGAAGVLVVVIVALAALLAANSGMRDEGRVPAVEPSNTLPASSTARVATRALATEPPPASPSQTPPPTSLPTETAVPALGSPLNPIVMSLAPTGDTQIIMAAGDRLAQMIGQETGLTMATQVDRDFAAVRQALGTGQAHLGWLNTFNYMLAHRDYGVQVALVSVRLGSAYYQGQIVVRADSSIASLEDLKGKVMCWVDPNSTSGYIIPRITLQANGIDPDQDFSQTIVVGSHNAVIAAVYNGECDAGASYVDARSSVAGDFPDVEEKVVVLVTTTQIPNDSISFSKGFPQRLREDMVNALLAIAQTEEGQQVLGELSFVDSFERVDDSIYDPVRSDLEKAGIQLEDLVE